MCIRDRLGRDPGSARVPLIGYAAAVTIALWLTYLVASSVAVVSYSLTDAVLFLGPLAVVLAVLAPRSLRQMLGPIAPPEAVRGTPVGAPPGHSGGIPGAPGQPYAGQGAPPAQPGGQYPGQQLVSYTHLDVYKRQGARRARLRSCRRTG